MSGIPSGLTVDRGDGGITLVFGKQGNSADLTVALSDEAAIELAAELLARIDATNKYIAQLEAAGKVRAELLRLQITI